MERNNNTQSHILPRKIRKAIHFLEAITDIVLARVRKMVGKAKNIVGIVYEKAQSLVGLVYERVIMDTFTETQAANKKDPTPINPLPPPEKSLCAFNPKPLINKVFESVFNRVKLVFHMVKRIEKAAPMWLMGEKSTNPYYFYSLLVR